jgi:hypothetical protein
MTRLNISETYLTKKYNPQRNLFTMPIFAAKKYKASGAESENSYSQ